MSKKSNKPFNNPFDALKLKPAPAAVPDHVPPSAKSRARKAPSIDDEAALFLESVGEVARVKHSGAADTSGVSVSHLPPDDDAESLARLAELVSGDVSFEMATDGELVAGWVRGFDERVRRRLKRGDFPVAQELDLHGQQQGTAKLAVERFVDSARVEGLRCIAVVTGRGLHSPDGEAILKRALPTWLTTGRLSKSVLAFCTAAPQSGGAGVFWVLLRR